MTHKIKLTPAELDAVETTAINNTVRNPTERLQFLERQLDYVNGLTFKNAEVRNLCLDTEVACHDFEKFIMEQDDADALKATAILQARARLAFFKELNALTAQLEALVDKYSLFDHTQRTNMIAKVNGTDVNLETQGEA